MSHTWSDLISAPAAALAVSTPLQRKCDCGQHTIGGGGCEECGKNKLQRHATGQTATAEVAPMVQDVLRSPGQPLDTQTRAFMEPRFGFDFSRVRVHSDESAAASARAVSALAYTSGLNVVFGAGQYAPTTDPGRRLLAHELTHVMQQRNFATHGGFEIGQPGDAYERQADEMATAVMRPTVGTNQSRPLFSPGASSLLDSHGAIRRQHADSTATGPVQDSLKTDMEKRARESACPQKRRCTQPPFDRQVCCATTPGVTGMTTHWLCHREFTKGQFKTTQHNTSDQAAHECAKKP